MYTFPWSVWFSPWILWLWNQSWAVSYTDITHWCMGTYSLLLRVTLSKGDARIGCLKEINCLILSFCMCFSWTLKTMMELKTSLSSKPANMASGVSSAVPGMCLEQVLSLTPPTTLFSPRNWMIPKLLSRGKHRDISLFYMKRSRWIPKEADHLMAIGLRDNLN